MAISAKLPVPTPPGPEYSPAPKLRLSQTVYSPRGERWCESRSEKTLPNSSSRDEPIEIFVTHVKRPESSPQSWFVMLLILNGCPLDKFLVLNA